MKYSEQLQSHFTYNELTKITDELKYNVIEEQKNHYMNLVKDAGGLDTINDGFFSWTNSYMTIHIFLYKNISNIIRTFIVCTKNKTEDEILLYDLVDVTDISFRNENSTDLILSMLIKGTVDVSVPFEEEEIIFYSTSIILKIPHLASRLFNSEYNNTSDHFKKRPIELVDFNMVSLHADKYQMTEIIESLENPQFSAELGECLFAYENEKFYICAAGIGGLIEYMMYLSIEKHGDLSKLNNNPTTNDYIGALKKEPFNIDRRAQSYIRSVMGFRNSVSHYNSGFTSKEICDHLFDGLKNIFINYYLNEPLSTS